jgi:transglutaminase-like putative cysteine protease
MVRTNARIWLIAVLVLAGSGRLAQAEPVQHLRMDHFIETYVVNADQTYVLTTQSDTTLLTRRGVTAGERETMDFYPKSQTLELLQAWVDQPDGTRLIVQPGSIFTRPSAAAQSAPGFTDSQTTTVLFPQVHEGSQTHTLWRLTQKTAPLLGLQITSQVPQEWAIGEMKVDITAPDSVPLHWRARGGFVVEQDHTAGVQHLAAVITDHPGTEPERSAVSAGDFQPIFLATSLPDLATIGAIYHRESRDRAMVTPAIDALAATIVGDATGLDAAKAIYNWVAVNIRYVAVYLDQNDGWVPHPASEVLARGYGDCKDHAVIMQALLAARGIKSDTALIEWGRSFEPLPLWVNQFNHAIVYLPDFDLYVNPTNPYARFGSVDPTLSGKLVVIATESGRVARTPDLKPQDARYSLDTTEKLLLDGTIEGNSVMAMSAYPEAAMRHAVASASSTADLAERILNNTPEGGFGDFVTSAPRDLATPFRIAGHWRSLHGAPPCCVPAPIPVAAGLDLSRPSLLRQYLSREGERHNPMMIGAKDLSWNTTIALPEGARATVLPDDVALTNAAGSYTAHYIASAEGLRVERHLVIDHTVYTPKDVPALEAVIYAALDDARAPFTVQKSVGN